MSRLVRLLGEPPVPPADHRTDEELVAEIYAWLHKTTKSPRTGEAARLLMQAEALILRQQKEIERLRLKSDETAQPQGD